MKILNERILDVHGKPLKGKVLKTKLRDNFGYDYIATLDKEGGNHVVYLYQITDNGDYLSQPSGWRVSTLMEEFPPYARGKLYIDASMGWYVVGAGNLTAELEKMSIVESTQKNPLNLQEGEKEYRKIGSYYIMIFVTEEEDYDTGEIIFAENVLKVLSSQGGEISSLFRNEGMPDEISRSKALKYSRFAEDRKCFMFRKPIHIEDLLLYYDMSNVQDGAGNTFVGYDPKTRITFDLAVVDAETMQPVNLDDLFYALEYLGGLASKFV